MPMTQYRITSTARFPNRDTAVRWIRWALKNMLRVYGGRATQVPDLQEVMPDDAL